MHRRNLLLAAAAAVPTFVVLFVLVTALLENVLRPSAIVGAAVGILGALATAAFVYAEYDTG